jgi:SRSO17 transposase
MVTADTLNCATIRTVSAVLLSVDVDRIECLEYASGLLSNLEHKTSEGIAYLHDQDRKPMQQFVGESPWQHGPVLRELSRQVGTRIGEPESVIAFDPSGFAMT